MTDFEYEQIQAIRRSDLWKINTTPAAFKWHIDHKDEEEKSDALILGALYHKAVLEPETFDDEYSYSLEDINLRTKEGKAKWAELQSTGKQVVKYKDVQTARAMAEAVHADPLAHELLTGAHEVPYFWKDEKTGEMVKCKADCITTYGGHPYIVDYKTTNDASDRGFYHSARAYGYDFQAGMYTDIVNNVEMAKYGFAFVAQEKTVPYLVHVFFCDDSFIEKGREKYRELIELYHKCNVLDVWPGYEPTDLLEENYD